MDEQLLGTNTDARCATLARCATRATRSAHQVRQAPQGPKRARRAWCAGCATCSTCAKCATCPTRARCAMCAARAEWARCASARDSTHRTTCRPPPPPHHPCQEPMQNGGGVAIMVYGMHTRKHFSCVFDKDCGPARAREYPPPSLSPAILDKTQYKVIAGRPRMDQNVAAKCTLYCVLSRMAGGCWHGWRACTQQAI